MEVDYFQENVDKWRMEELLSIIDEFENMFSESVNAKGINEENYATIVANICGKTLVTSREIITLCANGYPDGALSLARNVFEQMIVLAFFEGIKNEDKFLYIVEKYFQSYELQRNKILKDIYEQCKDVEKEAEFNKKFKELKAKNSIKKYNDYWWSGHSNFSDLCKNVIKSNKEDLMHNFLCRLYSNYKRACIAIHANCMGNAIRLGTDSYIALVDTSPTTTGQEHPLFFLTSMLIYIVCTSCVNYDIDYSEFKKSLNELASFYLKIANKQSDL